MDLAQSFAAAQRLLSGYRSVACKAQEESPNALSRACKCVPFPCHICECMHACIHKRAPLSDPHPCPYPYIYIMHREEPGAAAVRTASDALLADALDGLLDAVSPSFLTAFLLPALVHYPSPSPSNDHGGGGSGAATATATNEAEDDGSSHYFLLPDHQLTASASPASTDAEAERLAWARHRQLYAPLLVRLQRRFPGFAHALDRRLALGKQAQEAEAACCVCVYGRWRAHLRTRDWHSHFTYGRQEALFALRRTPGVRFNLRDKPPENWTQPEVEFMLGPASASCFREGLGRVVKEQDDGGDEDEEEDDDWALCEDWRACPLGSEL